MLTGLSLDFSFLVVSLLDGSFETTFVGRNHEAQTRTPEDFNAGVKVGCTRMHHRPPLHLSHQHLRWKNKNHAWECIREAPTRFQSLLHQKKRSQQHQKLRKRRRILQVKQRRKQNQLKKYPK